MKNRNEYEELYNKQMIKKIPNEKQNRNIPNVKKL